MNKFRTSNSEGTIAAYDPIAQEFFYVEGTSANGAVNVNADISGSGTLSTDLTDVGGDPITLGQKTAANSLPVVIASDQSPISTLEQTGLLNFEFDYIAASYPDADTEEYAYYTGGSGGTLVATITVNYTDSTKEFITNVTRS